MVRVGQTVTFESRDTEEGLKAEALVESLLKKEFDPRISMPLQPLAAWQRTGLKSHTVAEEWDKHGTGECSSAAKYGPLDHPPCRAQE